MLVKDTVKIPEDSMVIIDFEDKRKVENIVEEIENNQIQKERKEKQGTNPVTLTVREEPILNVNYLEAKVVLIEKEVETKNIFIEGMVDLVRIVPKLDNNYTPNKMVDLDNV